MGEDEGYFRSEVARNKGMSQGTHCSMRSLTQLTWTWVSKIGCASVHYAFYFQRMKRIRSDQEALCCLNDN